MTFAVEIRNLCKDYAMGDGVLSALKGVDLVVRNGELLAITGESGSGKSTLLHLLGALDTPTSGELLIAGQSPFAGSDKKVSQFRNGHIGFVFQHNNLLPEFDALENVMMPALIAEERQSDARKRAEQLLQRVGLGSRLKHFPGQMSGGEQQRVAIARALINNPVLLLADEPSGNLDSRNAQNIHTLFAEVNAEFKTTVVVVTHNAEFARSLPRRIEMRDGRVVSDSGETCKIS